MNGQKFFQSARGVVGALCFLLTLPSLAFSADVPDALEERLEGAAVQPSFATLTLTEFIHRLYAETLGFDVLVSPELRAMTDPVELRLQGPVTPRRLFHIGRSILAARGVTLRPDGKVLAFTPAAAARMLPQVTGTGSPDPQRDVFVQVPLKVVTPVKVGVWLAETLASPSFNVDEDTLGNTVLLSGPPAVVEEALRMVKVLDQPRAVAAHGLRIVPRFQSADRLATDLVSILQSEGIAADARSPVSTVIVMPLLTQNAVAVFATRRALLDHVAEWARHIDRRPGAAATDEVFSWPLEYQQAEVVVDALHGLLGDTEPQRAARARQSQSGESAEEPRAADSADAGQTGNAARLTALRPPLQPALVADTNRNAVVFRGPVNEWQRLSAQIRAMDVPGPSVLVEVLVVEIRLEANVASGLEWLASGDVGGDDISLGSTSLGLGDEGFNLLLRDGATVRAALDLFAGDSRVAIRSRPRLVVASGHEARLEVGDEIPVVASTARSTRQPDSPLVSTVAYRRTGLVLAVRPTVHAGDRLDIEVMQDLSRARETASSGIDSPTILSRRLQTTVSLRDGGAVLLGGLLASSGTTGMAGGMPLPAPANVLDARLGDRARTELLVLIRPQVLRSPEEASAVSVLP